MGLQQITGNEIAAGSIAATDLASASITGDKLGLTAINANNIVNATITTTQIASNTISNTNIQTGAIENYSRATGLLSGMRNRIINGAMVINQRNTTISASDSGWQYAVDRWAAFQSISSSKFTLAGSSTAPTGFTNSLLATSSSAYTLSASEFFTVRQPIEGFNSDFGWGTASAKTVTLSFWVRSSVTGTFAGFIQNANDGSRTYPFTYAISVANTFEYKTITIEGDTSGTWLTNNGAGPAVCFSMGCGSTYLGTADAWTGSTIFGVTGQTNLVATNGATWFVTGVQLEVGSTATSFDYRPIGTELALCQRYYWQCTDSVGQSISTNNITRTPISMPVVMRAAPTLVSGASFTVGSGSAGTPLIFIGTGAPATVTAVWIYNSGSAWTLGQAVSLNAGFNSEL